MSKLSDVNVHDIPDAIRMGCLTMVNVFDADDDHRPFFASELLPNQNLSFNAHHSESHVPGRHLNALLRAEETLGFKIDEEAIDNHSRAAFFSYSGAIPMPLNRNVKEGPLTRFIPHNIREGFHALHALVKYRQSDRAEQMADASIAWILKHWTPAKGWDRVALERAGVEYAASPPDTFILGLGRAIGPLVKYYSTTGSAGALELLLLLVEKATSDFFHADGDFDPARFGTHTHSTTCVMSGLAQFAELRNDAALLLRVRTFYDRGLWKIRDELGWVIENTDRKNEHADLGEINNTGDIIETALILGAHGFPDYYQDAERMLRGHLLPSQLRDISFVPEPTAALSGDGYRDVAIRHLGAFGFPAPYGHLPLGSNWLSFNMDIVGGATASLCEVYRHIARRDKMGIWVDLLFDYTNELIRIESPYTHNVLRLTPTSVLPLWIRIPTWVGSEQLSVQSGSPYRRAGAYLIFPRPLAGKAIEITFPLVKTDVTLHHLTRDIRVRLRGDEVVSMDNFQARLTFFDPYE